MGNARNGIDSSAAPQGFVGPVVPFPFEASGMPVTHSDAQRTAPVPISALTTALASATPEKRMVVCNTTFLPHFEKMHLMQVGDGCMKHNYWFFFYAYWQMLGEQLYPLVERLEPDHVAKVTGMLLEMDQTEVLHLIESPDALKKKVAEAMQVLQEVGASSVGDQLGSLALNE
jgi:polyadenylate-binding protein